jgi:hypothetical protein
MPQIQATLALATVALLVGCSSSASDSQHHATSSPAVSQHSSSPTSSAQSSNPVGQSGPCRVTRTWQTAARAASGSRNPEPAWARSCLPRRLHTPGALASPDRRRDGRPPGYPASDRVAGAEGAVEDQPRLSRTCLDSGPRGRWPGSDEVLRRCFRQQRPALPGEGLVALGVFRSRCWLLRLAHPWTRVPRGPDLPGRVRLWPRLPALSLAHSRRQDRAERGITGRFRSRGGAYLPVRASRRTASVAVPAAAPSRVPTMKAGIPTSSTANHAVGG